MLVVAGTRVARVLIAGQLTPHGFDVGQAGDGDSALVAATGHAPDVILLDAEMPGEDGFALLDRIKAEPGLLHVPVVFISHRTNSDEVAQGLRRGAHDYLRKPVEPSELVARVMGAVRLKALQDRLRALNEELRHSAGTDALTGLPNRRVAAEQLDRLLARARRHDRGFALLLADVDHFKAVNDTHGHAIGDEALVGIARRIGAICRRGELLARWGGEELLVLSEEDAPGGAAALAERTCAAVAGHPIEAGPHRLPLTVSVGWTAWRAGDEPDTLLARADRALYAAKAAGRASASGDAAAAA